MMPLRLLTCLFWGVVFSVTSPGVATPGATAPGTAVPGTAVPDPIVLRPEPLPFVPTQFYITDVVDARTQRGAFARLVAPNNQTETVDLQGGTAAGIYQFVRQSLRTDKTLRAVTIRVSEFRLTETAGTGGRVQGRLTLRLTFTLTRDDEPVTLYTYSGGASYVRPIGGRTVIEPTIRQTLVSALQQFNNWINKEANQNENLAGSLRVNSTDVTQLTPAGSDTVFYNPDRPLTWDDFRAAPPRITRYAAQVSPSFAYEGRSDVKNGVVHINLLLKVYMLKSSSWVTEPARNAYALNHEQRHFDIAKLVVERFKRKIQADSLTLTDYNSIIQYQYIESFREMNRMQDAYDAETRHGLDVAAQERWNRRIDDELRTFKVK